MTREHWNKSEAVWTRKPSLKWTKWFDVDTSGESSQPSEVSILNRALSDLQERSKLVLETHNISFMEQRAYATITVPDFLITTIRPKPPSYEYESVWPPRNDPSYWNTALFKMMSHPVYDAGYQRTWLTMADGVDPWMMIGQYEASAIWASCATVPHGCSALWRGGDPEGNYVSSACEGEGQHDIIVSADMTSHSLSLFVRGKNQCGISWSPWSSHAGLSVQNFSNKEMERAMWMDRVQQAIQDLLKHAVPPLHAVANSSLLAKGPGWTNITLKALGDVATKEGMRLVVPKYPVYVASMAAAAQALNYFDEGWDVRTRTSFTHELVGHDEL